MIWQDLLSERPPPPADEALAKLVEVLPPRCSLLKHYKNHNGGIMEADKVYLELYPVAEILDIRNSGNGGWPLELVFFGGNGASEAIGVRTFSGSENYFSTQWVASVSDITDLGDFESFQARVRSGDWI